MGFFIDDLFTNKNLVVQLLCGEEEGSYGADLLLGVAPITPETLNFGIQNNYSAGIDALSLIPGVGTLSKALGGIPGVWDALRSGKNQGENILRAATDIIDQQLGSSLNDVVEKYGLASVVKAFSNDDSIADEGSKVLSKLTSHSMVSASNFRKMFTGSTINNGLDSITLVFISGMTMLDDDQPCNVRDRVARLVNRCVGSFNDGRETISKVTGADIGGTENLLGFESAPNGFQWSGGFKKQIGGTFQLHYGSGVSARVINDLLISSVNITLSPILTIDDDYYYALVTVGFENARKFTRDDLASWMGISLNRENGKMLTEGDKSSYASTEGIIRP